MKTAPVMPPPRPPRASNVALDRYDWHEYLNAGRDAKWLFYGRMFLKFLALFWLVVAVGQLVLIVFNSVHLRFFF